MAVNKNTRAPKQLGDFGEGVVNYVLIRKNHEVAKVDQVGADLISENNGRRFAISVKTRFYKKNVKESLMYVIEYKSIDKLIEFSNKFNLEPLFAVVVCLEYDKKIYTFILHANKIKTILKSVKKGYSLNFGSKNIGNLIKNKDIDTSFWQEETIGNKVF
jgi:Holliday junction resolvase